ncbi:L-ribulose-5-phosphate 4-epimerase AraD [Candidatus Marinimicrobia bacterium]|nr:L-ribulose-5-phosphate 4-epimerase AraD [Candidatus Neomarinimicrobiota bacterium]
MDNNIKLVKDRVFNSNKAIVDKGLVIQSFGNASARYDDFCMIKPSGVNLNEITPDNIVKVRLDDSTYRSDYKPSSDTPTHVELYNEFKDIGGIVHTHSIYATSWAQANKSIPCLGTTHADYWIDEIPVTDSLLKSSIVDDYEINTGTAIVNKLKDLNMHPLDCPGILVSSHGVFSWGENIEDAVKNAELIEYIASLAFNTILINPNLNKIRTSLHQKHYKRKNGPNSYYGQKK